jgi:UTP-glucose-1-phosphate uridylyltransferase
MPSRFIHASRFIFTPEIIEELSKEIPGKNNEVWLTEAENRLMQRGELFLAVPWEGYKWLPVGDPVGWLQANIEIARKDDRYKDKLAQYLSQIEKVDDLE